MHRRRTIDPEVWTDSKITKLSLGARYLYLGLISTADDEGRLEWDADQFHIRLLAATVDVAEVQLWMDEIAERGLVQIYGVHSKAYAYHPAWHKHQYISRPTDSKLPDPPGVPKRYVRNEKGHVVRQESLFAEADSAAQPAVLKIEHEVLTPVSVTVSGMETDTVVPSPVILSQPDLTVRSAPKIGAARPSDPVPVSDFESAKKRLRPIADPGPTFEPELETEAAAFIAFCAESNKTGTIAASRTGAIRREIAKRLEQVGLPAVLHGLREALRLEKPAIEYAVACMRNYQPEKAAHSARASGPFPGGKRFAGERDFDGDTSFFFRAPSVNAGAPAVAAT